MIVKRAVMAKGGYRADLDKYFRSKMEANWARWLVFLYKQGKIKLWSYENKEWTFPVKRGNTFYKCDFEVINNDLTVEYHEVKGWMDTDSRVKLTRMTKYYPDVKIIVVDQKQYKAVARKARQFIKEWE